MAENVIGTIIRINIDDTYKIYVHKEKQDVKKLIRAFVEEYKFEKIKIKQEDGCEYFTVCGFAKYTQDVTSDVTTKFLYWLQKFKWKDLLKNINVVTFEE